MNVSISSFCANFFFFASDGVDYFLGTADDELWPLIQGKLDVLNKVGLSKDNFKVCVVIADKDLLRRKKCWERYAMLVIEI
jgi:hypothetical protein